MLINVRLVEARAIMMTRKLPTRPSLFLLQYAAPPTPLKVRDLLKLSVLPEAVETVVITGQ
jgi:hypothetical protein